MVVGDIQNIEVVACVRTSVASSILVPTTADRARHGGKEGASENKLWSVSVRLRSLFISACPTIRHTRVPEWWYLAEAVRGCCPAEVVMLDQQM